MCNYQVGARLTGPQFNHDGQILEVKSAEINFLIRDPSGNNHKVVLMGLSVITSLLLKNVLSRWVFVCCEVEEVWRREADENREERKGRREGSIQVEPG